MDGINRMDSLPLQMNPSTKEDKVPVPPWSHQETRELIGIRTELEQDFTTAKQNNGVWEVVAAKMKERGYRRTPDQCKCKWKNLLNRYKGKQTSDPTNSPDCPFFEELHTLFMARAKGMQRLLLESEDNSTKAKKGGAKRMNPDQSSDDISKDVKEFERDSDEEKIIISSRKRKAVDKSSKQLPNRDNLNRSSSLSGVNNIQEIVKEFIQQQQAMEMQWSEAVERRARERDLFEQELRESMLRIERERLMQEQAWREREEERRIREERRAERRDALLTTLLSKLIHEK